MKILLLDNHDSFTFNLAELLRRHGKCTFKIVRSDQADMEGIREFDGIIFSPGPGLPEEQGAMFDVLKRYGKEKPVLGICLGMQAIALHFGGDLFNLSEVVHGHPGKLSITRPDHPLFSGIPQGSVVGLYHSWAVNEATLPSSLEILARSEKGVIMSLSHKHYPVSGFQFHPESIITEYGQRLLNNWLERV